MKSSEKQSLQTFGFLYISVKLIFTLRKPRTKHVRMPRFVDITNNNLVERLNGTVRERGKVMRGMKKKETATVLMEGLKNYYNFLRPHMGIENKTPAKKAGINLELGRNRWHSIIRKGSIKRRKKIKVLSGNLKG